MAYYDECGIAELLLFFFHFLLVILRNNIDMPVKFVKNKRVDFFFCVLST